VTEKVVAALSALMKRKLLIISVLAIQAFTNLFLVPSPARNEEIAASRGWQTLETRHTVIKYKTAEDLSKFDKAVVYAPADTNIRWLYLGETTALEDKIRSKTDAIFERVQEILDMRKSMKKVTIQIHGDKDSFQKAFHSISEKYKSYRAGYIFEYNSIFINVNDVYAGMLAHEMAHAIIDHYMTVRPPSATAEILARYVDGHLTK
jgi:hypothetical protein